MTTDDTTFLPYATAVKLVGAIQEEEHIQETNRRILTVYGHENQELCWFDYQETVDLVAPGETNPKKDKVREMVQEYILNHIPSWVQE